MSDHIYEWLPVFVTMITTLLASTGFWTYMQSRDKRSDATTRLLMGLAYARITSIGMSHIERGWITKDEYEDFRKYLYEPYKELGGNGVGDRIMEEVGRLPIRQQNLMTEIQRARINWRGDEDGD